MSPQPEKDVGPTLLQGGVGARQKGRSDKVLLEPVDTISPCPNSVNERPRRPPLFMYLIACCAALNSVGLGYDIGVSSGVAVYIEDEMDLDGVQVGLFFGCLHFVAAFGGLCSHALSDRFGRRFTFLTAQLCEVVGIIVVCSSERFLDLMAGRLIIGAGVGVGMAIDPLYIAEAAPASHRGALTSWSEFAINFGIMLGFAANWALAGLPAGENWRAMVAVGAILPIVLVFLAVLWIPESPRWLSARGRTLEAAEVLRKTHPEGEDVGRLMEQMRAEIQADEAAAIPGWMPLLCPAPEDRRALFVGMGVAIGQQITANESVIFYSPTIFERAGLANSESGLFAMTMFVGIVKASFVAIAAIYLDSVGRRPLLYTSTAVMAVCMAALAVASSFGPAWLALLSVLSYVACFSLGVGPITWLMAAELFPSQLRAKAMSLAVFLNRITSGSIALTFLPLADAFGGQAVYFLSFSVVTLFTAFLFYMFVPETKRLTLEELAAVQSAPADGQNAEVKASNNVPDATQFGMADAGAEPREAQA